VVEELGHPEHGHDVRPLREDRAGDINVAVGAGVDPNRVGALAPVAAAAAVVARVFPERQAGRFVRRAQDTLQERKLDLPAASARRPAGSAGSRRRPRLFVFRWAKSRLDSRSGRSAAKGASRRAGSPPGGSTLITSAPRSASSFVPNGPATPVLRSSTRKPAS